MQIYDYIMIFVLLGAIAIGAWQGMAWQIASIASIFVSYAVALRFRGPVADLIQAEPPWNGFLAMLIVYLAVSLLIWIAFQFVSRFIERFKLKEFDRQVGALVGFAKGVLLCIVITMFAVTLLNEEPRKKIINSYSGYYIAHVLEKVHPVMPEQLHDFLYPHLHKHLNTRTDKRSPFSRSNSDPGSVPVNIETDSSGHDH